jgi:hypothetical protein
MILGLEENPAVARLRLRQLSDDPTGPKPQMVAEMLEHYDSFKRVVIYTSFTDSVDTCVKMCLDAGWAVIRVDGRGWQGFKVPAEVRVFQAPLLRVDDHPLRNQWADMRIAFVGNAAAGGKGLTLTASPCVIWYSVGDKYEDYAQGCARISRADAIGADVCHLTHLPTDRQIFERHAYKKEDSDLTANELRRIYGLAPIPEATP